MESVFIGTEIKYVVEITADGFNMFDDVFKLQVMKGRNVVREYAKTDLIIDGEDEFILCIDTQELGAGTFDIAVIAYVADSHFPDGYRTEIERLPLMTVKKL